MADPPTHFFKFIPPGFKFNLSIPTSFLTQLKCSRCSKATLRRGCHEWCVDINEDGVFGDGWRKFVTENGVQESDFIVFKHQGNMVFDFLVFDQSSCERQYPNNLIDKMEVEEEPLTESDTIRTHKGLKKLKKRKRSDYAFQDQEKVEVKKKGGSTMKKKSSLTPNNHPCFISNLKPSTFKYSVMSLPIHFSTRNGLKIGEMILRNDKGRSWTVHLNQREDKFLYIGYGIKTFLVANGLKEGDTFKFELVEQEKDKPPIVNFSCINGLTPELHGCRHFMGELNSRNLKRSELYFPRGFARYNGLMNNKNLYLKNADDERLWKAKVKKYKNRYCIGKGWRKFCVANELKEGDCFELEIVDKGEMPIVNLYLQKTQLKAS